MTSLDRRSEAVRSSALGGHLTFEKVAKRYQGATDDEPVDALVEVSFEIGIDESVGVIGPNGAGKTTVLKLAAGVTAPTSGRIRRSKRALAVIELGAGIHTDLTGRENIDLLMSLTMDRPMRTRNRFDQIVEFSELGAVLDQPTRHYSSGMVARLAFAVAVHAEPDLLMIDEVLSVGDLAFQQRCRDRIFEMRALGTTVVVVSHDLELIGSVCDRTILIVEGRVELDGETDPVINSYLGRPGVDRGRGDLDVRIESTSLPTGEQLEVQVELPAVEDPAALRLDYLVPTHVELRAEQGNSRMCGTTSLPVEGPGHRAVTLGTHGLPPGRYELHVALEDSRRNIVRSNFIPFTLVGAPGPVAIRLAPTMTLDGAPVGSTG